MTEKVSLTTSDFRTRALEIASDLSSIGNLDHAGKHGEDWARARATYIRELYEILTRPSDGNTGADRPTLD